MQGQLTVKAPTSSSTEGALRMSPVNSSWCRTATSVATNPPWRVRVRVREYTVHVNDFPAEMFHTVYV